MNSEVGRTEWSNVYVVSVLALLENLQKGFFIWSFWPYLRQIDPLVHPSVIGTALALMGLGEAISSPLLGRCSNGRNGVRKALLTCYIVALAANFLYLTAKEVALEWRVPMATASRFVLGLGTGSRAIGHSYTSSISTVIDRRKAISTVGGGLAIGVTMGPGVQTLISQFVTGKTLMLGIEVDVNNANVVLGIVFNLLCIFVLGFLDERVLEKNDSTTSLIPEGATFDRIAIGICIFSRIDRVFINTNFKSIGFLYSEVMFGFSETEAMKANSNAALAVSFLVVGIYFLCAFTSFTRRLSDRLVIVACIVLTLLYHGLTMPWPFLSGHLSCERFNSTRGTQYFPWCASLHPISEKVYFAGFIFRAGVVFPLYDNSVNVLLTKLLGPGKHGSILGATQSIACLSKILGPLVLTFLYDNYGPQPNWALELLFLAALLLLWILRYGRMRLPKTEKSPDI